MKNRLLKSLRGNLYYYNVYAKSIGLLHPAMEHIWEYDTEDTVNYQEYYRKKVAYWKKCHVMEEAEPSIGYGCVCAEDIMKEFINTNQIVFEVTNHCNMKCKYCGYGLLYDNYDERDTVHMSFDVAKTLLIYLKKYWNTELNLYYHQNIFISFYGGEPLLNFNLIKQIVTYLNNNPVESKKFTFSMTTNALLLDKYMDFIVENKFRLLISLDGGATNNSYRTYKNGKTTYDRVIYNVKLLKDKYPDYFSKYVDFNSVLHDRNSVIEAATCIYNEFEKLPGISELNTNGVKSEKKDLFYEIFKDTGDDFDKTEFPKKLENVFKQSPSYHDISDIVYYLSTNVYNKSFSDILMDRQVINKKIPTGTCIPFSRKIFISATGLIYPCERIGNDFEFGKIEDKLQIDYSAIASMFNILLTKYAQMCDTCYEKLNCQKCIIADTKDNKKCPVMDGKHINDNISSAISLLENKPELYADIILKTVIK